MQTSQQESGRTTPCQFVPTDGWPEVGLSLLNQDCIHLFFPTQMVLWKCCCITQWLCNAPGSSGGSQYNPNALVLRHPLGCLCLHPPWNTGQCYPIVPWGFPLQILYPPWHSNLSLSPDGQRTLCRHCENLPAPPHSEVVPWKGH